MSNEEISEKVKELLVEYDSQIDPSIVTDATTLSHVGMDSLDTLEFIMSLEEKFDINIPTNQFANFGELVRNIENTLKSA